jgi:hypothetical protein
MEFAYDGGGLAKGGDVTLYYDAEQVGQGRVDTTRRSSPPPTRRPTSAMTPGRQYQLTHTPADSPERSTGFNSTSEATRTTTSSTPSTP